MHPPGWLTQSLADVPDGEEWLGEDERRVLAGLRVERRRADWRLGRWTAKAAVGAWLEVPPARVQILGAPDGAPEALLDGARVPLSVSISHRGGRALAAVIAAPCLVGCDLEVIEARSAAFIREWFAASEQRLMADCAPAERALLANLIWTAKEAAAKVRRAGLRLDVRQAVVRTSDAGGPDMAGWRAVRIDWCDAPSTSGWWHAEPGWVMTIAGAPAPASPRVLFSA